MIDLCKLTMDQMAAANHLSPSLCGWVAPGASKSVALIVGAAKRIERKTEQLVHVSTPFGRLTLGLSESSELRLRSETTTRAMGAAYVATLIAAESGTARRY